MWRNQLRRLLLRYPVLWGMLVIAPLVYIGGSYLLHVALYRMLSDIANAPRFPPNGVQIIAFSFFSSFGLTAFLMTMIVHLLSPDDTVFSRIFAPLPISLHQQYLGTMLPGFLCLFVGQLAMWGPVFGAFVRSFPVPLLQF